MRNVPQQYRIVYEKAISGKSRKMAIKSFCLECCGWEYNAVANCTDSGCPLFAYRPYKVKTPIENRGVMDSESILSTPAA